MKQTKKKNASNGLSESDGGQILVPNSSGAAECDWSSLSGHDWCFLLRFKPQLAEKCDWSKLDEFDWKSLQNKYPEHCIKWMRKYKK
jgi:hypothetical protein